jgi:hypothetical protein
MRIIIITRSGIRRNTRMCNKDWKKKKKEEEEEEEEEKVDKVDLQNTGHHSQFEGE